MLGMKKKTNKYFVLYVIEVKDEEGNVTGSQYGTTEIESPDRIKGIGHIKHVEEVLSEKYGGKVHIQAFQLF